MNHDNAEVIIDSMPEHQTDAMARTLIYCVGRMFEDSRVKEDYERWKRKREETKGKTIWMKPIQNTKR